MHVYTLIYNSCDRWKDGELKKTIEMLRRPEFDSKEVDPDLHKRMQKAVQDGRIKCFNLRERPANGSLGDPNKTVSWLYSQGMQLFMEC